MRIYILKANAHALVRLRIEHCSVGLEVPSFCMGFEEDLRSLGPRIGHFHIATVETQLGQAGRNAGGRAFLKNLGRRREWKPGSSAPLVFHECPPDGSGGILSFVRHVRGHKNARNEAKAGEKVMLRAEGLAPRYLYRNKRTYVLFKFSAVLPMIFKYAKPLLLPTACQKSGDVASSAFRK
jgi:hypothetical protein